jgi:nucleotide-binding universal stress UspA family protein
MFDHILIALDGSAEARSAGELGLRLAQRVGARVTGLLVVDVQVVDGPAVETLSPLWGEVTGRPFQPEVMRLHRERADAALDEFCLSAEAVGLERIERCVEIGVAEDAIVDKAADADLLVMGRRGEHAVFGRRSLGATLWRVLHRAPCPVLVAAEIASSSTDSGGDAAVSPDVPVRPLVAWESGPGAAAALELAMAYCRTVATEMHLVHAGDESYDINLDEVHARLAASGVSWESSRLDVPPAEAVAEALRRWEADCLFMGAFGKGRVREFLFGSNTGEILERVQVPVFVTAVSSGLLRER